MDQDELKRLYTAAYKIIRRERKMRQFVFRSEPERMQGKLAEMDELLGILTRLKDALKEPGSPQGPEQPRLLDVPRREQYG